MKIIVYTITECPFSKQEKEYLLAHGLQFEEKNLDTNREYLTEMLAVGSNFAGTPLTKIDKDDGQIVVLKGFTQAEFDKALGLAGGETAKPNEAAPVAQAASPVEVASAPEAVPPTEQPAAAAPITPPEAPVTAPATTDPAMASLLNNLEQQAQVVDPNVPPAPVAPPAAAPPTPGQPVIPEPQF